MKSSGKKHCEGIDLQEGTVQYVLRKFKKYFFNIKYL